MSVVLIGGGQGAAQTIMSLRQGGYEGAISLVSDEAYPPYQRPPLSKAYMKGDMEEERLFLRPHDWYAQQSVDMKLGVRALSIDSAVKSVALAGGDTIAYEKLVIATGSRPRPVPIKGADADGVFDLRTLDDVKRIRPHMREGRRIVIVGAGYIGLEAAAVARQMGLEATVIELADRVLARVTSPLISAFFEKVHKDAGVKIVTGAGVSEFRSEGGVFQAALLDNGDECAADIALVGIGILPNEELAKEAGVVCDNGIVVDEDARTSDPDVFAVGDCTTRPLVHYGRRGRLESVHNAIEQGKLAAAAILGKPRPAEEAPWFWSDQFDLKLQIVGLSEGYDDVVVRGDMNARKFAAFYFREKKLIAVDAVNSPPEFLISKKLIAAGASPDPARIKDAGVSMKDIAAESL
ncbi:MAG: FAD-dependent oxidoreductase [Pseudomonadota bacterium]